jgi:hypothetical protein
MMLMGAALAGACSLSTVGEVPEGGTRTLTDGAGPSDGARTLDGAHPGDGPRGDDGGSIIDAPTGTDTRASDASDAGVGDVHEVDVTHAGPPTIVQTGNADNGAATSLSTTLSPVHAGSFLAVLATYYFPGPTIAGITDNSPGGSNTYTSASLLSVEPTCQASEIWYVRDAGAGATSVTVTMSASVNLAVWVLEVSGLGASGGVDMGEVGNGGATTTITAPSVTPSGTPALIVSALGSCGTIGSIAGGNPFTALPKQSNNGAAYYIATTAGAYGPVFTNSYSGWNASIAAFR